jgi:adenylate cyclase
VPAVSAWLGARFKGSGGKRRPLRVRLKEWFGLGRLIGFGLLVVLGLMRSIDPAPIKSIRVTAFDFYQTLKPRKTTRDLVTIVDIDENSLAELGQWPWPRTYLAQIVQNLTQLRALVVGFDMFFTEPDRMSPDLYTKSVPNLEPGVASSLNKMPSNDRVFALAVKRGRVVMGQSGFHREIEGGAEPPKPTPVAVNKEHGRARPEGRSVRLRLDRRQHPAP